MKSKLRHIINLFILTTLFAVTGCEATHLEDVPGNLDGYKTIGYMAVRLMPSDGGSRASVGDEFDAGTLGEMQLSNEAKHYAIFFTGGQDTPIAISELNGMSADQSTDDRANSSMVYATIVGRNELKEEFAILEECYVLLNTDLSLETLAGYSRRELLDKRLDSPYFIDSKGNRFFTMSNSVYVENGQQKIHTEVDTDKIYSSYQETIEQAWRGNAAVTAYVERMAAKFSLGFEDEALNQPDAERVFIPADNQMILFTGVTDGGVPFYQDKDPVTGIPYTYRIRLTSWGMNGLEKESYLFRHFDANGGYFDNWYNTGYKRAFWSTDCHYEKEEYPWQYRKVIDNSGIPVYEGRSTILKNLSYSELNVNGFGTKAQYAPENTYNFADATFKKELNNRPEFLAGTHVIVCAEMLSNIEDPHTWAAHEIYRDRNGSFYRDEKECAKALVASMNNTLKSHSYLKFTYWDWSKGGVEYKLFASTKGEYSLYYKDRKLDTQYVEELYDKGISLMAEAEFKGSDGKRILWSDDITIQDDKGNLMQSYSNIDEVNSENNEWLRESTVNDLKSVIFEHVGAVDHFKDGKMYYAIPVGYIQKSTTTQNGSSDYSVYGVVRNSDYRILITGVSGLGTSVDNVDQPIIPNTVSSSDHLFIGFKILEWHPIEQEVPGVIN